MTGGQILGCERAYARSHPKIWVSITGIPKELTFGLVELCQLARKRVRIKLRRGPDQRTQIIPWRIVVGLEPDVPLALLISLQQTMWIGQKSTMDESQPDMILADLDLADSGTDDSPASRVKVAQVSPANDLSCIRRDRCNDIS